MILLERPKNPGLLVSCLTSALLFDHCTVLTPHKYPQTERDAILVVLRILAQQSRLALSNKNISSLRHLHPRQDSISLARGTPLYMINIPNTIPRFLLYLEHILRHLSHMSRRLTLHRDRYKRRSFLFKPNHSRYHHHRLHNKIDLLYQLPLPLLHDLDTQMHRVRLFSALRYALTDDSCNEGGLSPPRPTLTRITSSSSMQPQNQSALQCESCSLSHSERTVT